MFSKILLKNMKIRSTRDEDVSPILEIVLQDDEQDFEIAKARI